MDFCIILGMYCRLLLAVKYSYKIPDSRVHGANMGPIWGRQDPGGPHVGPMNFAIWDMHQYNISE